MGPRNRADLPRGPGSCGPASRETNAHAQAPPRVARGINKEIEGWGVVVSALFHVLFTESLSGKGEG